MSLRHLLGTAAVTLGLVTAAPPTAVAQSTTSLAPEAATIPRGVVRLRLLPSWTRYDALYGVPGTSGATPLAGAMSTDSLTPRDFPLLGPSETAIRAAAGSDFRLTAGKLVTVANSRVVVAPLVIEYGLTNRLTLGVAVPLVETRTTLFAALNPQLGFANVGPNPARLSSAALTANAALVGQFTGAANTLNGLLTTCATNPTQSGCAPIVGHEADARALVQTSNGFAGALATLYGTGTAQPGQDLVPLIGATSQQTIDARIARFDTLYRAYLGTSTITGRVAPAGGPAGLLQFQDLLGQAGYDSLASTDRTSIGDITVGATLQLVNTFGDSLAPRRFRFAVNGNFRIGTGEPAAPNKLFDLGTGTGQMGVEGGAAADAQFGRKWGGSASASYTHQLGTINVARVKNPANAPFPLQSPVPGEYSVGDVLSFAVEPHMRISPFFALNANYWLLHVGADRYSSFDASALGTTVAPGATAATAHRVGFGFSYSTASEPDRAPGRLPFELSFSHLETIYGTGGPIEKAFRDQIELRVYIR